MKLTKNFTLKAFEYSETAIRKGIDNSISEDKIKSIKSLSENVLQVIRDKVGRIDLTSGYRCLELNLAVGGASNSQHMLGEAADFVSKNISTYVLYKKIQKMNIDYDQLIYEKRYKNGDVIEWIHISYTTRRENRRQFFEIIK